MRTGGVPAALLLVLAATLLQVSTAGDIYWEGEEDASNEFLEVKDDQSSLLGHLKRFKRDWFTPFDLFSLDKDKGKEDTNDDDGVSDSKDDDLDNFGSGSSDKAEPEQGEKTLRVTFLVMEPYRTPEYSNRDSPEFQNFSRSLANSVDLLFENLPGTQKSSLVRIQSIITDDFWSNVTLDIVTTGYDDTDRIIDILHNHIKNNGRLGSIGVRDEFFKAQLIDPAQSNTYDTSNTPDTSDPYRNNEDSENTVEPSPNEDQAERNGYDDTNSNANNDDQTGDNGYDDNNGYETGDNGEGDDQPDNTTTNSYGENNGDQTGDIGGNGEDRTSDNSYDENRGDQSADNIYGNNDADQTGDNGYNDKNEYTTTENYYDNRRSDYGNGEEQTESNGNGEDETGYNSYGDSNLPTTTDRYVENRRPDYGTGDDQTRDNKYDDNRTGDNGYRDNRIDTTTDNYYDNNIDQPSDYDDNRGQPDDTYGGNGNDQTFDNQNPWGASSTTSAAPRCTNPIPCAGSYSTICPEDRCDGKTDCPYGDDEQDCERDSNGQTDSGSWPWSSATTTASPDRECPSDYLRCDETRCVPQNKRCDNYNDCTDGTDERDCPTENCGTDDFYCSNGKCIEPSKRCDRVYDCPGQEDEADCPCSSNEFRCESDGFCIEEHKRCDGVPHCSDSSDEQGCGDWYFRCKNGKRIPQHLRCNREYDCPSGDFSDEQNCPCGESDFKCDNGHCIPASKRCDRTHDCQDGSDERHCTYGKVCMAFECTSGICVQAESRCNGTAECDDGSDELNCPCKRGQYQCRDGSCINIAYLCNGRDDCKEGEDEYNCYVKCPRDKFTCFGGSVTCATKCDDVSECDGGEDEENCAEKDCSNKCSDGTCLSSTQICDHQQDCDDGSDELYCDYCDGPNDFRCKSGECVSIHLRCNGGVEECPDGSDELDCNITMTASKDTCNDYEFQCVTDKVCINGQFYCDGNYDCQDESDEANCSCPDGGFQCASGGCVPSTSSCDGTRDCADGSDELDCPTISPLSPGGSTTSSYYRPATDYPVYTTTPSIYGYTTRNPNSDYPYKNEDLFGGTRPEYRPPGGRGEPGYGGRGQPAQPGYDQTGDRRQPGYGQTGDRGQPGYDQTSDRGQPGYGQTGDRRQPGYDQTSDRGRPGYDQTSDRGRPGYDQTSDRGRPGYDQSGGRGQPEYGQTGGRGRPGYEQTGDRGQPGYDPSGDRRQPGYDQYGQPEYDQSGDRRQPGYDAGSKEQPGYDQTGDREQPGYDQTGDREQPGYDQTGDREQPGYEQTGDREQPGYDQTGGRGQPGYDQSGGRGQPGYDQTRGRGQPGYDQSGGGGQVGYDQSGGRGQPGYDQTGGRGQPGYDQTGGRGQPGYDQTGGRGQPGYDQTGGRGQPGYDQSGGDGQTGDRGQPGYGQIGGRGQSGYGQTGNRGQPGPWGTEQQGGPAALRLRTMPSEQEVRFGGDVVFQCRDEGPRRAPVRWVREGGKPIKPGSRDVNGRLEMDKVTTADAGVYICQATGFLGQPGSEVRVRLDVQYEPPATSPPFTSCRAGEATCGNGECIPKAAVCDGRIDCSDRSDEENCHHEGLCEPNQHKCDNGKCVLKSWVCDSEDDCGDGSDERNCGSKPFDSQCSAVEFSCSSDSLCIPRSYHCDGHNDCPDGSDEIGCIMIHVTQPPLPSNLVLNPGETLILTCRAVGVPVPLISWRRNWGHVPPQCVSTSVDGVGTLTCDNIQTDHSGAYSCEAISIMGTNFATPDAIVFVNNTGLCPRGYFNNEARSESECIPCFCFGESTQCHSADLFTYNMPTPLGEGGTRLVGIKQSPNGEVQLDSQPINNQYFYESLRNGATVTKLAGQGWSRSDSHPYLTLPETYNGNQLTSYGGHIKYTLSPQTQYQGNDNSAPTIIIKGKYGTLVHASRSSGSRNIEIEARLTPGDWMKSDSNGLQRASREDIMMALDDIEMILLRADFNNAGVNISNFAMESAQHINVGLGAASLVEECTCPKGYEGLSCQKCASGFVRKSTGAWLGACVAEECPAGTYGNPSIGIPCKPCPCPLTNPENQFAGSCSLRPDGNVQCDCFPGYEGQHCEYCASGYEGNPLVPGDRCQQKPTNNCNPTGTKSIRPLDECECKDNVQGRYCDQCKNGSFYLSSDFRQGCALCFCSGVTQNCKSSNFRRKTISVQFNVPQIVDQVKVYNSAPSGQSGFVRYKAPVESDIRPQLTRGDISFQRSADQSTVYYWSLPDSFAGDKVTSYGGYFRYTLKNVPTSNDRRFRNNAADIQLISDNSLTYHYVGNFVPSQDGILNVTVQLLEKGWQRPDGKEIARQHFLLALADVKTILIKASYAENAPVSSPVSASIDVAEADAYGPMAVHVEQCTCPAGYIGTSCEDCAPGYTRSTAGLYLALCEPCECNGKSNMCNPETGVCYDCTDNTDGEHCELCKPGYEKDPYGQCVNTRLPEPCQCDPRGTSGPCDNSGICYCKQNVEGESCDRCRPGTFGLDAKNPTGCLACFCSGVTTDCHEANHYTRIPIAAPMLFENYGGYTITDLYGDKVIKDHFLPQPEESELMYIFQSRPDAVLYWSLPVFPGNRVLSYGGSIYLRQKFSSDVYDTSEPGTDVILEGDNLSLFWTNPNQFRSGESFSYQIPLSEAGWYIQGTTTAATRSNFMNVLRNLKRVLVKATVVPDLYSTSIADVSMDIATQSYESDLPAAKGIEVCMCPVGYTGTSCESCQVGYYQDAQGYCRQCPCNGHGCQLDSYGQVICNCAPPYKGPDCSTIGGDSSTLEPTRPPPPPPPPSVPTVIVRITSPKIKIQEVGSSVNFTCEALTSNTRARLPVKWSKSGGYLPSDRTAIDESRGLLVIRNLQVYDSGIYICESSDGVNTNQAMATLKVPGNEMTYPVVEVTPTTADYYEGDRIELDCKVSGNPAPEVRWQRATNRPLPLTANTFNNMLIIDSARVEDAGEYTCVGTNTLGSDDRTAVITVRPRPSWPSREKLTVSNGSPSVIEGQNVRIVCTGSANLPAESIDWVRQDNVIFLSNVRSENGVLLINKAVPENQGVYICQSAVVEVSPVPVLVTVINQGPPTDVPNITVSADSLRIPTGGSASVECNPLGRPSPQITWKKHDGEFGRGVSQRGNTLIISSAQEDDRGYYVCEAYVTGNLIKNIYVYIDIEKREIPSVAIWPEGEQAVTLGGEFSLMCRVLGGTPEPDVMWSRNGGRPLSQYAQIQPNHVLKFEKIEVNDEGEYTCTATNPAGIASASAIIKVRSAPEITITPGDVITVLNGDALSVECRANGYPEPMVSIKTVGEYREVVPPSPGYAALRVSSATIRDDGEYVCSASSLAGTIEEQFVVRVERGDGGYDGGDNYIPDEGGSGDGVIDPDDNPAGPYETPSSLIAFDNQPEVTIYCNTTGTVRWDRTDGPLQRNAVQYDSRLIIYNVSKSDSGDYVCSVYNIYNEVQNAAYTRLIVISKPRITLRPPTQTVRPGQSPTVECVVEGDDILRVAWRPVDKIPSGRVDTRSPTLIFHQIEVEDAGLYECFAESRYANASATAKVIVSGPREVSQTLVSIDKPTRPFRAGDNVQVMCKTTGRDTRVEWQRPGTNQYVDSYTYGGGAMLVIQSVTYPDAGLYRCVATDKHGRTKYDDFNLEIESGSSAPVYPYDGNDRVSQYQARLNSSVDLPCNHNLEQPVSIEWRREFSPLSADIRANQPVLRLDSVTEADAGTYICRVSNSRATVEAKAILIVTDVIPKFDDKSFLSLPTLGDAFRQFEIEISFKPNDRSGLILYNSENQGRQGDYIALQLQNGVPEFIMETGSGPLVVKGDRPLQLNAWHTIRISRLHSKVTMDVDNTGPFIADSSDYWGVLDLKQPLYIGGVPDQNQLPARIADASGYIGCVSMLILRNEEKNLMLDSLERYRVSQCDSCAPNLCLNGGVCQEARNERGYMCICPAGFAGLDCDRTGEACRPGLCGPGKCSDTEDGYKCACPVTHTGKNCEVKQSIEYPAFTGSTFLAIKPPNSARSLMMSMMIKAASPVTDGIIMYCAESQRGYGGFTSLAVRNGKLEFRYDLGGGIAPVVLVSDKYLPEKEWVYVQIARVGLLVSLKINQTRTVDKFEKELFSPKQDLNLHTPIFVGGVDESITLNNSTGVTGGFNGCIKNFTVGGVAVDIMNDTINSENVQECNIYDRGDIPEMESVCHCKNGGSCTTDPSTCSCPSGYTGQFCEQRIPSYMLSPRQPPGDPCAVHPCLNGGTCRLNLASKGNYSCDCPLGYAGATCQISLRLTENVGFNGDGYLELPGSQLDYERLDLEPAVIAMAIHTTSDGVLLYQKDARAPPYYGDYLLLRIERGIVILDWDMGSGKSSLSINNAYVNDGERHQIIAKLLDGGRVSLSVDNHQNSGTSTGLSNTMNADSNIYIGGIPESINYQAYPGFTGCIEQIELMSSNRGLDLGTIAVTGRNTQRCK